MTQSENRQLYIMVGPDVDGAAGIYSATRDLEQTQIFVDGKVLMLSSFAAESAVQNCFHALQAFIRYFWLLLRGKGDVLHVYVRAGSSFWRKSVFIWLAFVGRRRIVFHCQDSELPSYVDNLPAVLRTVAVATIRRCDQVLCQTRVMQGWFEKLTPNVPAQWWPSPVPKNLFNINTPTGQRAPVVLFLGELNAAKGVTELLEAFAGLHRFDPDSQLVLGGTGSALQTLQLAVAQKGLQNAVVFLGAIGIDEKNAWLRRARVLALPSYFEAQPHELLEAMASGAAVLGTNVGGIPDMMTDGVHGLLVAPGDTPALEQALIRLWTDVSLRERLVGEAYQSTLAQHEADEVSRKLYRLYQKIINRNRTSGKFLNLALRYRLIDFIRGSGSIRLLRKLRALQYQTPEQIAEYSRRELATYFAELKRLPLYKDVGQFADLPIIDKRYIKEHQKELMNPYYKGEVIRKKTGGSTGEPLVYYTGGDSQAYLWAGIFLSWQVAGYQFGDKVAFFAGSALFATGSKPYIYYKLLNVTIMTPFDMSNTTMAEYGERLQKGKFRLVYGFSQAMYRMARYYLDAGLTLKTSLRAIICTSEKLTPAMRKDIEACFGVPCYSQYGCNDAGISSFECEERNGFHLITTRSYHEVQENGELISTDMANRTMFMPRYNSGDMVRMSGRICPCGRGFPLIDEVIGRQNDIVIDTKGNAVHSEYFNHMFRENERVYSLQVVFNDTLLEINLHTFPMDQAELDALEANIRSKVASKLEFAEVRIQFNQPFRVIPNGKHRFVVKIDN